MIRQSYGKPKQACIIDEVKRIALFAAALLFTLLLAACARKNIETKDAIRQAVVEYLNARQAQTGLDMSIMDVNVMAMTFERDTARATVEFRVKNSEAGMQLNYTLDRKGDKWVVQARQDSGQGHGVVQPPSGSGIPGQLPPGHPSIPPPQPTSPKQ
jgi:outer membrane murein-binding lipoprotein Lpp